MINLVVEWPTRGLMNDCLRRSLLDNIIVQTDLAPWLLQPMFSQTPPRYPFEIQSILIKAQQDNLSVERARKQGVVIMSVTVRKRAE
jgi:hypothetical protein